jgi:hypothetical protein
LWTMLLIGYLGDGELLGKMWSHLPPKKKLFVHDTIFQYFGVLLHAILTTMKWKYDDSHTKKTIGKSEE